MGAEPAQWRTAGPGARVRSTLIPDHDARWVLATAALGLFVLYLGYALHMLAQPGMPFLIIQRVATPDGPRLMIVEREDFEPGDYRIFTRRLAQRELAGATLRSRDGLPFGPTAEPSDAAGAQVLALDLRDGGRIDLEDDEMVRAWRTDRWLAIVGFAGGTLAIAVGISAYLLAVDAGIGIILLAANQVIALELASMPLAFTLDWWGVTIVNVGLPTAAALYLLFALRFPQEFLAARNRQIAFVTWLALGAFAGGAVTILGLIGRLYTPFGIMMRVARSMSFLASCVVCVALLAWYWWRGRPGVDATARALRRPLGLMLLGLIASFGTLVLFGLLPFLTHPWVDRDLLTPEMASLATLGIPLGFAAALLSRQNFGFPLVLRRNIVTLLALLLVAGLGTALLLVWWQMARDAAPSAATLIGLGLLLLAAPPLVALYHRLRHRLIGRLFRDDFDLPIALRALGDTVTALGSARAIAEHLLPRLCATLDLTWARLEVPPADGSPTEDYAWGEIPATPSPARAIALISQGEVVGRLSIGPKRHDLPLRREDAALADTLAPLLASALRNARLIAALQAEREMLEGRERALVALGRRATEAVEAERLRLARDLHDVALADLGALRRQLDGLAGDLPEAAEWAGQLAAIGEDVRGIIADMRPPELELVGLAAALRGLVPTAAARLGLELRLDLGHLETARWDPDLELSLYRATQEALTNAARHGRAAIAAVTLRQDGPQVTLSVADDGAGPADGVSPTPGEGGLGLLGMRERLAPWGGTVAMAASEGGGAILTIAAKAYAYDGIPQARTLLAADD